MDKSDLTPEEIEALIGEHPPAEDSFVTCAHESDLLAAEPMHSLHAILGQTADRFADALSTVLKSPVEIRFTGLQSQPQESFSPEEPCDACRRVFTLPPFEGRLGLNVAPSIIRPMIARLLGGDPHRSAPARRPMTEIEQRLAARIVDLLLTQITEAWSDRLAIPVQPDDTENDFQPSGLPSMDEPAVTARYEAALNETIGAITLTISRTLVDQIGEQLANDSRQPEDDEAPSIQNAQHIDRALEESLTEFRVTLAQTRLTAGELLDLNVGDVITTDQPAGEPLAIDVDGQTQFHVRPGTHKGHKAVKIERRLDKPS